jgi:hypothetical protein
MARSIMKGKWMFRLFALLAALIASPVTAQIVTSQVRLVDNSPKTPGIIIANAKTTPPVKKGATVFECEGGPPWRYSVAVACPAPAAPIVTAIAAARVTTPCKDVGANAQWTYASKGGTYGNACIKRAMDAVPLDGALDEPRVFQDITLASSRHFITQRTTAWKPFSNVTIQRVDITARKRGIFIRGGARDWVIQDFRITGSGINTSPGDIPVGIGMQGARNIVIRRGEVSGFKTKLATKNYENADCLSNERGDSATITDVYGHDCTDGIFDLKGTTSLDRVRGANAGHYTLRGWAKLTVGTLTSENPGYAHVQLAAATSDIHIAKLIAIGGGNLIKIDKAGGKLVIDACDLDRWTGKALVAGAKATVILGKGCER